MKKLLLLIAGIALLTVACRAEVNVLLEIEEDRSGSVTFEFGLDEEFREVIESTGGSIDDLLSEVNLGAAGGEATERVEGDMTYTGVTKGFDDIDEVTGELTGETGEDGPFTSFSFTMDEEMAELAASVSAPQEDLGELPIDPSGLTGDIFSASFILTMPGNVVEHNADEVLSDGRLRWELPLLGGQKDVYARSEFGGGSLWWLWIVLGVVLIVGVAAIVAAIILGKRQEKQAVADAATQYPEPAVPPIETVDPSAADEATEAGEVEPADEPVAEATDDAGDGVDESAADESVENVVERDDDSTGDVL